MSRAINTLQWINFIGKPRGYRNYPIPYDNNRISPGPAFRATAYAGAHAKFKLQVVSATVADYDGKTIQNTFVTDQSSAQVNTKTFDDDAPPPSTISTINIMGLTTVEEIAAEIQASYELSGCRVVNKGGGLLWIFQPAPGDSGNTDLDVDPLLSTYLEINGTDDFVGRTVKFYAGMSISNPLLWGPKRGMGPDIPDLVQSFANPV